MTGKGFVCHECRQLVTNPFEQYHERLDYVRVDFQERRLSRVQRLICRDCVDRIRERLDGKAGVEQPSLFGGDV